MRPMKLEELMGSLRTFEMNFEEERTKKKNQGIVLKIEMQRSKHVDKDKDLVESIFCFTQNLGQVVKNFNRSSSGDVPQHVPGASQSTRNYYPLLKNEAADSSSNSRNRRSGIRCRECDSFSHIQSECVNTLKKNNKYFNTTCSDGDYDRSREEGYHVNYHVILTTRSAAGKTSYEDDPRYVALTKRSRRCSVS